MFIFLGFSLANNKAYKETVEKYIFEATEWLMVLDDLPDETLDRLAEFINNVLLFYQKLKQDHSDRKLIETIKNMKKIENLKNDNQYEFFLQAVSSLIRRTESAIDKDQKEDNQDDKKTNKKIKIN